MRTITLLLFMLIALRTQAETSVIGNAKAPQTYNEYYTIDERSLSSEKISLFPDTHELSATFGPNPFVQVAKKAIFNLLKWTLHSEVRPSPEEGYIRKLHFGRWINDPTDETCMNTRAKVLVRDTEEQVTFRNEKNCVVDTGRWYDPYSAQEFNASRDIQIDHMVPLKHAYLAGAWRWDYKTRCLYANYMGYKNHLIPASVRENTSKGDRAPDKYLPTELSYRCQYVKDWLAIKLIWRLNMTADEVQAIHEVVTNYNCKMTDFKMSKEELESQRTHINDNIDFCMINLR